MRFNLVGKDAIKTFFLVSIIVVLWNSYSFATEYEVRPHSAYRAIETNLWLPETNTYVSINSTTSLRATASDIDCIQSRSRASSSDPWSDWSDPYPYSDNVTTGSASTDYHIIWTVSDGSLTDMYGTVASFSAPGYSGSDTKNVTVTATADDFNRGADTNGYNDNSTYDSITLKVWAVTVTSCDPWEASGGSGAPYDHGGVRMGFVEYGDIPKMPYDTSAL